MRRQDIQLLALARQGDVAARCEVGRRYLLGADGFQLHIATGLDHLTHANVRDLPQAARIIAESLTLEDILLLQQEPALQSAAAAGSANAQLKLGVWLSLRYQRVAEGTRWLEAAAAAGNDSAAQALAALTPIDTASPVRDMLQTLSGAGTLNAAVVATIAARQALADADLPRLLACLQIALDLAPTQTTELAELVVATVRLAERTNQLLGALDANAVETGLDMRTSRGDRDAAYALGRALCGIACGPLLPASLCSGLNMRKGVALLLRAADGGCDAAWLHLYNMHADHRLSVANPQMARFCLEKAAAGGQTEAQRKLGALILRGSDSLADSEDAIQWLAHAADADDAHAQRLLTSLVLPLEGSDAEAEAAIDLVRHDDPWLAVRMQLSRQFGLTKLEALCIDPAEGLRPWGLVVGKNPFITQTRLSAPRAVPALTAEATGIARRAAAFFGQTSRDSVAFEGDLRRRSLRQRRAFDRHGLNESIFFSSASSMTLEALRLGPKWAFRVKAPLQMALAA